MATMNTTAAPRGTLFTGIAHGVAGFFETVFSGLVKLAETNGRVKQIERLSAMSDAELAARGIERTDIVRHVFRDIYYV